MISNLGGSVSEKNPWGKRRLAYPIDKYEDGYYYRVQDQARHDPYQGPGRAASHI